MAQKSGSTEAPKEYHVIKAFKALNTKANRTAIDDDEFSWLQNAQPIGAGNIRIIPNSIPCTAGNANVTLLSNVATMDGIEVQGNTYIATFQTNGASQFYDVNNQSLTNVASNGTFSASNVTVTQFSQSYAVIGDPSKGLFVWDGNVTVQMGSGGAIGMLNVGSGYNVPPAVIVSAPNQPGGIHAQAEAVLTGNVVSEVIWTQPGTGYTSPPTLTLSGGAGTGAQAIASLLSFKTGQVYYQLLNGGQGYTSGNVVVTGGGGDGTAVGTFIVSNGVVINIIPTSLGNNYTNTANLVLTLHGDGSNAQVAAFVETNTVSSVQTYAGRVWVSQGRQMLYSAATNFNDFTGLSAGSFYVTDNTLRGNILGTVVANNFLYFYGIDSVNVVSDVLVNSSGTTNLTDTNVSASIGTRFPFSIFAYYRYVMAQNDYGVYGLIGSTMVKLSDPLDGIYSLIDFTRPVTAGQVVINDIICACFNFYLNAPATTTTIYQFASGYYQAVFFDKKWFISQQGTINYITGSPIGGTLGMFGASGNQLFQLYADSGNGIPSVIQTALLSMGDPIRDKQLQKFAFEATTSISGGQFNITVDNPTNSTSAYMFSTQISWINNMSQIILWQNNSATIIPWGGGLSGYQLYRSDAQQPSVGLQGQKYVGLTMTSNTPSFVLNTLELEYEKRARF